MNGKLKIGVRGRIERNIFYSPDGCWLWMGTKRPYKHGGYGIIKIDGRWTRVHRVSFETFKGPIPDGIFVCHSCDVPLCVNPDHLFLGTLQDNNRDMYLKGRNAKFYGDDNVRSKLKSTDIPKILELKSQGVGHKRIAKQYGVSGHTIRSIYIGRTWSHVSGIEKLKQLTP